MALDQWIEKTFPVITAPPSGAIVPPETHGQRFVVAKDGLYREVSTPWLYANLPIARVHGMPTPFGAMEPSVQLRCGNPPRELWSEFRDQAEKAMPNECAAVFVWCSASDTWRFEMRKMSLQRPDRVDYQEPSLCESEVAVVDIHSHGHYEARFSARDDHDDAGGIKISAVLGRVGSQQTEISLRLVCLDAMIPLNLDGETIVVRTGVLQ